MNWVEISLLQNKCLDFITNFKLVKRNNAYWKILLDYRERHHLSSATPALSLFARNRVDKLYLSGRIKPHWLIVRTYILKPAGTADNKRIFFSFFFFNCWFRQETSIAKGSLKWLQQSPISAQVGFSQALLTLILLP